MKNLRSDEKAIKEITAIFNCSVRLVHKLVNEKKLLFSFLSKNKRA